MRKTIHKAVSMYEDDINMLNVIAADTGLNPSEVVRQLIHKAFIDKKTRQIITLESYHQKAIKACPGLTSYNVQSDNEKNDDPNHIESPLAVSLNRQNKDTNRLTDYQRELIERYKSDLQVEIAIMELEHEDLTKDEIKAKAKENIDPKYKDLWDKSLQGIEEPLN